MKTNNTNKTKTAKQNVYQSTIIQSLNWSLEERIKSTKDQKGVTLLAKLGRVRLILRNISLDGINAKVFAVTGTVYYDESEQDACWSYDSLAPAWTRFVEAALVDLRDIFANLADSCTVSSPFTTAAFSKEFPEGGNLGYSTSFEQFNSLMNRWEKKLIADDYRRAGMEQQAEEIEKHGRS